MAYLKLVVHKLPSWHFDLIKWFMAGQVAA